MAPLRGISGAEGPGSLSVAADRKPHDLSMTCPARCAAMSPPRGTVATVVQFQSRSGPSWTTRPRLEMVMFRCGSCMPSASMIGRAGWLAVL